MRIPFRRGLSLTYRAGILCLAVLLAWTGQGWADPFQPMDKLYSYHDSGRGGAFLPHPTFLDIYIPKGQLPGPYGGWYNGVSDTQPPYMYPGHPGYPFQFRNGVSDIPYFIFDVEPGGYAPGASSAPPYLRIDSLWQAKGGIGGIAERPPYSFGGGQWWTDQIGGYPNPGSTVADFLSLPGDDGTGSGNSYVVVGMDGLWIDPTYSGADVLIQTVTVPAELARLWVTPDLVNYTLVGTLGGGISGTPTPGAASWMIDYSVDLAAYGITWPVLALKIEGIDAGGMSPGFDLASARVATASLFYIPEPSSVVLLGIAMAGFFFGLARWRKARRT